MTSNHGEKVDLIFRNASKESYNLAIKMGIPVTLKQGKEIVRIHPNGDRTIIHRMEKENIVSRKMEYLL